jgi:uncharacterized protein (TIGR03000 family)
MVTRMGMIAALAGLLLAGMAEAAPRGGGGGSSGGRSGGGGPSGGRNGGGSVSRGSSTGGRTIIAGPYGFGAGSSNNFGGGAFFGLNNGRFGNNGRNGFGGGFGGFGGYGLAGFGGMGVPLGYGYQPTPFIEDMPMPPPPPPPLGPPRYGAPGPGGPGTIAFTVPENALVWVNNDMLAQTGSERTFTTPPLLGGSLGSYSIRVKWTENGEEKSFTQRVTVRAAGRSSVMIFSRGDDKK